MQIKLHGHIATEYPDDYFVEAATVAEAIEGWSRQVGFYTHLPIEDRPVLRVLGFDTSESLTERTEQKVIHLVPAMIGGGGNFGKILIGTALIVAGVLALPNLAVGGALIGAGIGMVLGGVMGFFVKAPTLSKDNDPEASKYLGLSNNTLEIGTPISNCYGEVAKYGHVLALNVDSNDMITGTFPTSPT